MKKRILYCVFIAAFFIVCIIPSAGMLIFGESEAAANEMLAMRPSIYAEDGSFNENITDDVTSYIADRFAFRQEFITAYAKLHAAVFGESSSEDVILGSSDWLYYKSTSDDYLHADTLSDAEINAIAHTVKMMQQHAEDRGIKFAFTVAPNKNSIYPQYMPNIGDVSDDANNIDKLAEALNEAGVNYANLKEAMTEEVISKLASSDIRDQMTPDLYHRLDSHWNNLGAALGLNVITETLGTDAHDWYSETYTVKKSHKGDLYEMLYPAGKELDDQVIFDKEFSFEYSEDHNGSVPKVDAMKISTFKEGAAGSLLMFRDSFGNAFYPFMADSFGEAVFSRLVPYRMDWLDTMNVDSLVIEIVERNIDNLLDRAPIMAAPEVTEEYAELAAGGQGAAGVQTQGSDAGASGSRPEAGSATVTAAVTELAELSGYSAVTGNYDAAAFDSDTRVFIVVSSELADGGSGSTDGSGINRPVKFFEACPAGAADAEGKLTGRFTAYIPSDVLKGCGISVILCCDGNYISYEV